MITTTSLKWTRRPTTWIASEVLHSLTLPRVSLECVDFDTVRQEVTTLLEAEGYFNAEEQAI